MENESTDVLEYLNKINLFTMASLTLRGTTLGQETVNHIASHLTGMKNLTHLALHFEQPESNVVMKILSTLPSTLTSLEIYNADSECLNKISKCKKVASLKALKLSDPEIPRNSYWEAIKKLLLKTPSLETLDFTNNLNVKYFVFPLIEKLINQHNHVDTLILKNIGMTPELLAQLFFGLSTDYPEQPIFDMLRIPTIDFTENPLLTKKSIEEGIFKDSTILFPDLIEDRVE